MVRYNFTPQCVARELPDGRLMFRLIVWFSAVSLCGCVTGGGIQSIDGLYERSETGSGGIRVFCMITNQSEWRSYGEASPGLQQWRAEGSIEPKGDSLFFNTLRRFVDYRDTLLAPCWDNCLLGVFYLRNDSLIQFMSEEMKPMSEYSAWTRVKQ